jgi:hypothetical protein
MTRARPASTSRAQPARRQVSGSPRAIQAAVSPKIGTSRLNGATRLTEYVPMSRFHSPKPTSVDR